MQINDPAYQFLNSIAHKFDEIQFPGTTPPPLILDPKRNGIKMAIDQLPMAQESRTEVVSGRRIRNTMRELLPPEIFEKITSHAENFSEWVVMLGLTDPAVKRTPTVIDDSARAFLRQVGKIPQGSEPPLDQLLRHVYETVFNSSSQKERDKFIMQAHRFQPLPSSYSKWEYGSCKVQLAVARFFKSSQIQVMLRSILGAIYVRRMLTAIHFAGTRFGYTFQTHYVPKMVNIFMNNAPSEAVKISAIFLRVIGPYVKFIFNNYLPIQLGSLIIVAYAGSYRPLANRIRTIAIFPIVLTEKIFEDYVDSIVFMLNENFGPFIQYRLGFLERDAERAITQMDRQWFNQNRNKPYQLWMDLMKNPRLLYRRPIW